MTGLGVSVEVGSFCAVCEALMLQYCVVEDNWQYEQDWQLRYVIQTLLWRLAVRSGLAIALCHPNLMASGSTINIGICVNLITNERTQLR